LGHFSVLDAEVLSVIQLTHLSSDRNSEIDVSLPVNGLYICFSMEHAVSHIL